MGEVKGNIAEVLNQFKKIAIEKKLDRICFASSPQIENSGWDDIKRIFRRILGNLETKVIFALGIIKYPEKGNRENIIEECHCSAIRGHRGQNKTIARIKQKFTWAGLKEDVKNFVNAC